MEFAYFGLQKIGIKPGLQLFTTIVMVYAARKPHTLQIGFQPDKIFRFSITFIINIHGFQHLANVQIVLSLLIEGDIPTIQCSL